MAVSLSTIRKLVIRGINLSSGYTEAVDDPAFDADQIRDAILLADGSVVAALCGNANHPRRHAFFSTASVPHGGVIPSRVGPVESCVIGGKAASLWDKEEIEDERENVLGLTTISPHYVLEGSTLYHNGSGNAIVTFPQFTLGLVCQSPDEYSAAVACGALSFLFPSEGDDIEAGGFYLAQWNAYLKMISEGELVIPEIRYLREAA